MSHVAGPVPGIAAWLEDEPFLDGRAEQLFGPSTARREALGRAQELAHRLLERFFWGTDPSGRILLPGSRAETFWLGSPPELEALSRLASAGPAASLLAGTRAALEAPEPPPGPRRIAAVLAAFHRDLADAAPALPGLVPAELSPAGPVEASAYGAPHRRPVLEAGRLLAGHPDLFRLALVHGSLATLDERPGVSDLDLLVVLARNAAEDAEGLLAARDVALRLWPLLQRVDPLQHHGTFVLTPADLAFYPQVFLPLPVLREARVLAGPADGLPVALRPTGFPRRLTLLRAAEMLRRPLPDSLFLAKLHLQVVLLAPCFLLQANGRFVYKRDAFVPFEETAPAAATRAVAAASRARTENLYEAGLADVPAIRERLAEEGLPPLLEAALLQRHLLGPLPPPLRELLAPQAAADRAALADLLEGACTPLSGDLADDEFRRDPAPAPVPGPLSADGDVAGRWRETAHRYVEALGATGAVVAAWSIGTPDPGSDLDLVLVVDRERAKEVDWTRCLEVLREMPPADRDVLEHPPSAVLPVELAPRMGLLSPLFRCTPLWGEPPRADWWRVRGPDHALALAADYALAMYPGEMLRLERDLRDGGDEPPRPVSVARRVGAIRHTLALARQAGLEPPPGLDALVERARELRRALPDPAAEEEIARLPGEAVAPLAELVLLLAAEMERRGFPPARPGLPRVRGTIGERIVLVEGASARDVAMLARALEETTPGRFMTNVAPLPLAWGFLDARGRREDLRELFGAHVSTGHPEEFPPPFHGWSERWDTVTEHLRFLAEIRCPFAWFYPNHLHNDPLDLFGGNER